MDQVADAIQTALDTAAAFGPGSFTVTYNKGTQHFEIAIAPGGPLDAAGVTDITAISPPAAGIKSLFGPDATFLIASSLRQPEAYNDLSPGGQADMHFTFAADPTDRNFLF